MKKNEEVKIDVDKDVISNDVAVKEDASVAVSSPMDGCDPDVENTLSRPRWYCAAYASHLLRSGVMLPR